MSAIYKSEAGAKAVRERYLQFLECLHGSGANATMWMGDVVEWSKHFRCYAVDMIGEPGLSAPSRPKLNSDAYALWLDDVMQGLSLARASIVGVSLGGWLALDYATRRPDRIEKLALLCPGGVGRQKAGWMLFLPLLFMGNWGRRKMRERILGRAPSDISPMMKEMADFIALIFAHFQPRTGKLPVFSDEALRRLTVPVLAVIGAKDVLLNSQQTKSRLERNVRNADVRLLPDAGHLIRDQTKPVAEFLMR
jgi:pimeloyl-ACP methyl ester carboxylesterase